MTATRKDGHAINGQGYSMIYVPDDHETSGWAMLIVIILAFIGYLFKK